MLEGDAQAADDKPLLLVLDDLQQVDSPDLAPLMTLFLEWRPARLHLMLLGRKPTYGPLARLYAAEQVLELSKVELRRYESFMVLLSEELPRGNPRYADHQSFFLWPGLKQKSCL